VVFYVGPCVASELGDPPSFLPWIICTSLILAALFRPYLFESIQILGNWFKLTDVVPNILVYTLVV
jgi:hypothetical protein